VIIGEGKPENQNHAVIFAHGEALQTIDMNQDNNLAEALKMRNLLQELRPEYTKKAPNVSDRLAASINGSVPIPAPEMQRIMHKVRAFGMCAGARQQLDSSQCAAPSTDPGCAPDCHSHQLNQIVPLKVGCH
jgi:hypothetical protein